MGRLGNLFRNPFTFLFTRSSAEEHLVTYVIREHNRGRSLNDILEDRYLINRTTPSQRARLLDRPELIQALGDDAVASVRDSMSQA